MEFRFSCFQGKLFTDWAIFSTWKQSFNRFHATVLYVGLGQTMLLSLNKFSEAGPKSTPNTSLHRFSIPPPPALCCPLTASPQVPGHACGHFWCVNRFYQAQSIPGVCPARPALLQFISWQQTLLYNWEIGAESVCCGRHRPSLPAFAGCCTRERGGVERRKKMRRKEGKRRGEGEERRGNLVSGDCSEGLAFRGSRVWLVSRQWDQPKGTGPLPLNGRCAQAGTGIWVCPLPITPQVNEEELGSPQSSWPQLSSWQYGRTVLWWNDGHPWLPETF